MKYIELLLRLRDSEYSKNDLVDITEFIQIWQETLQKDLDTIKKKIKKEKDKDRIKKLIVEGEDLYQEYEKLIFIIEDYINKLN